MFIFFLNCVSCFLFPIIDFLTDSLPCVCVLTRQTQNDFMMICNVAKILELVVPLMEEPSENFLNTMEEDLMKLIIKYGMTVRRPSPSYVKSLMRFWKNLSPDFGCRSPGCPAQCQLPGRRCQQSHAQLQVCLGLFQSLLW